MPQDNRGSAPAISVTMAAYNVAPYVAACLDSVLAQSCADFELIVFDDCSSDETPAILREYAHRDPRIHLIEKQCNEGLALARNQAIAAARGEWVTFLDADDLFHPDMLRLALEAARTGNAEMVLWDYAIFSQEAQIPARKSTPSSLLGVDPTDRTALLDRPAFAWTRLVRRDALQRLEIAFPAGLTYQDVPVHWCLITQLERIALVPQRVVYYRQQPMATTAGKGLKRADYFTVLDQVEEFLRHSGQFETYSDPLTARQLNAWHGVYDVIDPIHRPVIGQMIADRVTDRHRAYLAAGKPMRWQARAFFRAFEGDRMAGILLHSRNAIRSIYRTIRAKL